MLTPDGPVAIETLREGDLVVARNEETGVSGVFPVTAVMGRQASEVLWLTLENEAGEVTRMGVTPTHPLFIAGRGWGEAGALVAGDAIRDRDLQPLTVLAVEVDARPQMVHNLEIAEAHTYFAGELEAWGHNAWWNLTKFKRLHPPAPKCNGAARGPDGKFMENPIIDEGNIGDTINGVLTGLADDNSGLCPNNPAGKIGNTLGGIIRKFLDMQ